MGNMCSEAPPSYNESETPDLQTIKDNRVTTEIKRSTTLSTLKVASDGSELWRDLPLDQELLVKLVHPHMLNKTISNV